MKLRIMLPTRIFLEQTVTQVTAETPRGIYCLKPRHVDFVMPIVPGIFSFKENTNDQEQFLATDEGILVKVGDEIMVSVRDAVVGENLGTLQKTIQERFKQREKQELAARQASGKLEATLVKRLTELERL